MAPRAWKTLTVGFGLVRIDCAIRPAVTDNGIKGKTLDVETMTPVKRQWVNAETGEPVEETVVGYETERGFVTLGREPEADGPDDIRLMAFVPEGAISPLYFQKAYCFWARGDGDSENVRSYWTLAAALRKERKMGIGKVALTKNTRLVAIRWDDDPGCLVLHILAYEAAVSRADLREIAGTAVVPEPDELELAEMLIDRLPAEVDMASFEDDYQADLRQLIELAEAGKPAPPAERPRPKAPAGDLQERLRASIDAVGGDEKPKRTRKRKAA